MKKAEKKVKIEAPQKNEESALRIFIKLDKIEESKLTPLYRLSNLNPGKSQVVLFDAGEKKYVAVKHVTISADNNVIERLKGAYGEQNVVVK